MYRTAVFFLFVFLIDGINSQAVVARCETKKPNSCRQHFQNLNRPVKIGDVIIICVKTIPNANVLTLNLQETRKTNTNTPLHLSLRFGQNILLRNAKVNGKWGKVEKTDHLYAKVNPVAGVKPGEAFTVQILVGQDKYFISVNGKAFATFSFRLPISKIHGVMAFRDLDSITNVEHISTFPQISSNCRNTKCVSVNPANYVYSTNFPYKLKPGYVIALTAKPIDKAERFSLRFIESATGRDLFQFNPRFPEKKIIRNSMDSNLKWLSEEATGPFPFVMNQVFKLTIGMYENEFRCAANGEDLGSFKYRDTDLFNKLNQFVIATENGLNLEIHDIEIFDSESTNYENFALYSKIGSTTSTSASTVITKIEYIVLDDSLDSDDFETVIL